MTAGLLNGDAMKPATRFISCDWGTSRLRLRLVEFPSCRILNEHATDEGIQHLAQRHPAPEERGEFLGQVLERGIAALGCAGSADLRLVISGMASSTLGWQSLPYAELPAPIDGSTLRFVDFLHGNRQVRLVSGLRAASDVMRGEETELIGLFTTDSLRPWAEDCTVVLPGSHSKHVRLRGGRITDFTTFLTGELYELLGRSSTLAAPGEADFDERTFLAGAQTGRSRGLSAALFQTRSRAVLGQLASRHSRAFLSGVLIGAEVAALVSVAPGRIVLAAAEQLAREYALALDAILPDAAVVTISPADLANAIVQGHAKILSLA